MQYYRYIGYKMDAVHKRKNVDDVYILTFSEFKKRLRACSMELLESWRTKGDAFLDVAAATKLSLASGKDEASFFQTLLSHLNMEKCFADRKAGDAVFEVSVNLKLTIAGGSKNEIRSFEIESFSMVDDGDDVSHGGRGDQDDINSFVFEFAKSVLPKLTLSYIDPWYEAVVSSSVSLKSSSVVQSASSKPPKKSTKLSAIQTYVSDGSNAQRGKRLLDIYRSMFQENQSQKSDFVSRLRSVNASEKLKKFLVDWF